MDQFLNDLSSRQRKFLYLVGMIVLLIPILILGLPSDGKKQAGGTISQLRSRYDLGESDLGAVDASGAAINLVLLGMRGIAVNQLWIQQEKQRDMKRWVEMQATTESIVRLQPHYQAVWDINGWNLAWNTSAEWDAVPDRYYWVKEGAKLLKRGVARNVQATELYYRVGTVLQKKIGTADESVAYRKYFVKDPDPEFNNGPDREINPDGIDNYLAAKVWFANACVRHQVRPQHILDASLFLSSPARCQFDYVQGLQTDGQFGEEVRSAWEKARIDWTEQYGREVIRAIMPDGEFNIRMEMTDEDIKQEAKTPEEEQSYRRAVDQYQKMSNYRYWRTRALAEAETATSEAHRHFYNAKQSYKKQEFDTAQKEALEGMKGFDDIFNRPEYASLTEEENLMEECMLGWKIWDDIYKLQQEKMPDEYPMKWLVEINLVKEPIMLQVNKLFKRLFLESR